MREAGEQAPVRAVPLKNPGCRSNHFLRHIADHPAERQIDIGDVWPWRLQDFSGHNNGCLGEGYEAFEKPLEGQGIAQRRNPFILIVQNLSLHKLGRC